MSDEMSIEYKVKEWHRLATLLKEAKQSEMQLRKDICIHMLKDIAKKGSKSGVIGNLKLKAKVDMAIKVSDEAVLDQIWDELTELERDCIKHKPEVIKSRFNDLDEDSMIMIALEEKPSAPTLEVLAEIDLDESPFNQSQS